MRAVSPPGLRPDAADLALLAPLVISVLAALLLTIAEWRSEQRAWRGLLVALAPALTLGALLRLPSIASKTPSHDEALTAIRASGYYAYQIRHQVGSGLWLAELARYWWPAPGSLAPFLLRPGHHNPDVHPPLYFVLARLGQELGGGGLVTLRLVAAALGLLAIVAAAWLGFEVSGSLGTGGLAATALAVSPLQVLYSQDARMYSLMVLLALAASAALVRFLRDGGPRRLALHAALVALGGLTHGLFCLFAAGLALFLATLRRGPLWPRARQAMFVGAAAAAASALPWIVIAHAGGRERGLEWLLRGSTPELWARRFVAGLALGVANFGPWRIGLALVALASFLVLAEVGRRRTRWGNALAVPAAFYVLVLVGLDVWNGGSLAAQPRYLVVPVSLFVILGAVAFGEGRERASASARVGAAVALIGVGLQAQGAATARLQWAKTSDVPPVLARAFAATPQATLLLPTSQKPNAATLVALAGGLRRAVWVQPWAPGDPIPPGSFILSNDHDRGHLEAEWSVGLEEVTYKIFRPIAVPRP
jgi:4-amino-4-deoxy-L-arabinose transferase-like glycosyltransferase